MTTTAINPIDLCKKYTGAIIELLEKYTTDEPTAEYLVAIQENFFNYLDNMKSKLTNLVQNTEAIDENEFNDCFKNILVKEDEYINQAQYQGIEISRNILREDAHLQIAQLMYAL